MDNCTEKLSKLFNGLVSLRSLENTKTEEENVALLCDFLHDDIFRDTKDNIKQCVQIVIVKKLVISYKDDILLLGNTDNWAAYFNWIDTIINENDKNELDIVENRELLILKYLITLELLIAFLNTSVFNLQRMACSRDIREMLCKKIYEQNPAQPLPKEILRSFIEIYATLLTVRSSVEDIYHIFDTLHLESSTIISQLLLQNLNDIQFRHFVLFENYYQHITLQSNKIPLSTKKNKLHNFTLQFWIVLKSITSNRLFTIDHDFFIEIKDSKLCFANDEFVFALFENFEFESDSLYHITLCLSNDTEWILYINGTVINTISAFFIPRLRHVEIGSMICSFKLYAFYIWSVVLPFECIELIYKLGIAYRPESSILNNPFIDGPNREQFRRNFGTIVSSSPSTNSEETFHYQNDILDQNLLEEYLFRSNGKNRNFREYMESFNVMTIDRILYSYDIIGTINEFADEDHFKLNVEHERNLVLGNILFFNNSNLQSKLLSIDLYQHLLNNLETCESQKLFLELLKMMITSWKLPVLRRYFTMKIGYAVLSHTLIGFFKKERTLNLNDYSISHKSNVSILSDTLAEEPTIVRRSLELFLAYCGYKSTNAETSLIRHIDIYARIILNFQIWSDDVEATRLIYQHLTDVITISEFKKYNIKQLKKCDAFWNLCKFTHFQLNMKHELRDDFIQFCYNYLLLEDNDHMFKKFIQYVVFLVRENNLKIFNVFLTVLDNLLTRCNKEHSSILLELLSPKLLLFILDELTKNKYDIIPAFCILLRIISSQEQILINFVKSDGIIVLFQILSKEILDNYKECIDVIISFSLEDNTKLIRESPQTYRILFLEVAIQLLELAVLNDILLDSNLNDYVFAVIRRIEEYDTEFSIFDMELTDVLIKTIDLLITLRKPQNNEIYLESACYLNNLIEKRLMFNLSSTQEIEDFLVRIHGGSYLRNASLLNTMGVSSKNNRYLDVFLFSDLMPKLFNSLVTQEPRCFDRTIILNLLKLLDTFKYYYCNIQCGYQFIFDTYEIVFKCQERILSSGIYSNSEMLFCESVFLFYLRMFCYFVYNDYFNWTTKQQSLFYDKLLNYQSIIFGNHKDDALKKFLFFAFLADLKKCTKNASICSCIRTMIHFNHDTVESLIFQNSMDFDENKETLLKLASSEDEEIIFLLKQDLAFINSNQNLYFYRCLVCRSLHFRSILTPLNNKELNDKVNQRKDEFMSCQYQEFGAITTAFQKEKEKFVVDVISSISKSFNNYMIDINENKNIQKFRLHKLNFEFSHKRKILNNHTEKIKWMISTEENSERMRMKLVPYFDLACQEKTKMTKEKSNMSFESLASIKKVTTRSMLSYDLLSDIDIVGIKEKTRNENRKVLNMIEKGDSIESIWNCCLVVGLDLSEGILILGESHFYYISNFFFDSERIQILTVDEVPIEKRDLNINFIEGSLRKDTRGESIPFVYPWKLSELEYVSRKPFLLSDVAIEVILFSKASLFFNFESKNNRNEAFNALNRFCTPKHIDTVLLHSLEELSIRGNSISSWNGITSANLSTRFATVLSSKQCLADDFEATRLWKQGKLSNFYYLMIINTIAGRSFNDITQYPIFPWVIADYSSDVLDLDNVKTYRDLSKPMGAQTEKRMNLFIERYEAMKTLNENEGEPFHYGTHYSSAMIVSSFLLRLQPFTKTYLLLQDGQFGPVDRLFNSISRTWLSASKENSTDVRELIPEFYYLPEFLVNTNNSQFGQDQNGKSVNDVVLPPWAHGDPKLFVSLNRRALESKYVTENLPKWIDLIFGFKQRGENAIAAVNVFNYLSYPGAIKLDNIVDETKRRAMTNVIYNFGQTPLQIFQEPHPTRSFTEMHDLKKNQWTSLIQKDPIQCAENGESIHHIILSLEYNGTLNWKGFSSNLIVGISPILKSISIEDKTTLVVNGFSFYNTHLSSITCMKIWSEDSFLTGDEDGLIKIWKYNTGKGSLHKLVELSQLSAHLASIWQIDKFNDCNILVTLDCSGALYTWNLSNFQLIRKIEDNCALMCVSSNDGNIASIDTNGVLRIYNINGSKFTETKLCEYPRVTSLSFMEILSILDIHDTKHGYYHDKDYLVLGHIDGSISIYHLTCEIKRTWDCKFLTKITTGCATPISTIRSVLLEETNNEVEPSIEICAGRDDGKIVCFQ